MKEIRVVLIGFGYWGVNLARNIVLNPDFKLVCIVDSDPDRLNLASSHHKTLTLSSVEQLKNFKDFDLAVIATRPSSHRFLANLFLSNGIHCLITKPVGISKADAVEIENAALRSKTQVFCDFTYHFSPYINFIKNDKRASKIILEMKEYVSYRTALGIIQSDVDVLADLAVHDIYILKLFKGSIPKFVQGVALGLLETHQVHSAFISLRWEDGFSASIHVSWKAPKKSRLISIISDSEGILLEELNKSAPVQIVSFTPRFSTSFNLDRKTLKERNESFALGMLEAPVISAVESLEQEFREISKYFKEGAKKLPTIVEAIEIWSVIESLRESIENNGRWTHVY